MQLTAIHSYSQNHAVTYIYTVHVLTMWSEYNLVRRPSSRLKLIEPRYEGTYVRGSSKIQTLCHMTQVLLKLGFTAMETLTGY